MPDAPSGPRDPAAAPLPERPASFAERGLAVPFTAPLLAGARLRRRDGAPPEVLLPAPSGRGVQVLDWPACLQRAAPTLHDRMLWEALQRLPRLAPAALRRAALGVAALGHAGRPAQAAATATLRGEEAARRTLQAALATRLGALAATGSEALPARLAGILAGTGAGPLPGGRLAAQLAELEALSGSLGAWAVQVAVEERRAALVVLGAVRLTQASLRGPLAALAEALADLPGLVARGEAGWRALAELAERPDWILDGWALPCALWRAAPPAARPAATREMAALLPLPPQEMDRWPGPPVAWNELLRSRRLLAPPPAWTEGELAGLTERNERLRAMAA